MAIIIRYKPGKGPPSTPAPQPPQHATPAPQVQPSGVLLFTLKEAAAKLAMSVKHLREHVEAGSIRFIDIAAPGAKNRRYRFTESNLNTFIGNQKKRSVASCPSTKASKVHITGSISKSTVVAFTALQKPPAKKKP